MTGVIVLFGENWVRLRTQIRHPSPITIITILSTWVVVLFGEVGVVCAVEWTGTTEEQNLWQQKVPSLFLKMCHPQKPGGDAGEEEEKD